MKQIKTKLQKHMKVTKMHDSWKKLILSVFVLRMIDSFSV